MDELKECNKSRSDLQEKIWELENEIRDVKINYIIKFNALVITSSKYDCLSGNWVKEAVDHLLRNDPEWVEYGQEYG